MSWIELQLEKLYTYRRPLRVFYALLGMITIVILLPIVRSIDILRFFARQPDLFFYIYILTFIFSIVAVYQMVIYYKVIGSLDFLLIALTIYMYGILFFWQSWTDYLTPIGGYLEAGDLKTASRYFFPEVLIGRFFFFSVGLLLIIHAVRFHGWSNYRRWEQIIVIILTIDYMIFVLVDVINTAHWPLITAETAPSIDSMLIFRIFKDPLLVQQNIPYYIILYNYIKVDPVLSNRNVKISRWGWIIFAIAQLSIGISLFIVSNISSDYSPYFLFFQVQVLLYFTSTLVLSLILIFIPEAFLISEMQFHQALKLYRIMGVENDAPATSLIVYKERVAEYLDQLPSSIKSEIGSQ